MAFLSLTRATDNRGVAERLRREQAKPEATSFAFFEIDFDRDVADALIGVLRLSVRDGQRVVPPLAGLSLYGCPGNDHVDRVLDEAVRLDVFEQVHVRGGGSGEGPGGSRLYGHGRRRRGLYSQLRLPSLRSFGTPLRSCRNLRRLQLTCVRLSSADMQFLRRGLQEDPRHRRHDQHRLERLSISNAILEDDETVRELCAGLRRNRSLLGLALVNCNLTDEQVEQIVHALMESPSSSSCRQAVPSQLLHPTLHHPGHSKPRHRRRRKLSTLRLCGNRCHERGLKAIAGWLSQPSCSLTSLQLSRQKQGAGRGVLGGRRRARGGGGNNRNGRDGPRMELKYLTQNWDHDPVAAEASSSRHYDGTDGDGAYDIDDRNHERDCIRTSRGDVCPARNWSLKELRLSGNPLGVDDMSSLAALLHDRLHGLEELDLGSNGVSDAGLAVFALESSRGVGVAMGGDHRCSSWTDGCGPSWGADSYISRSRLRVLRLSGNNGLTALASRSLLQILQVYPELESVTSNDFWKNTAQQRHIQHLRDINGAGRVLISQGAVGFASRDRAPMFHTINGSRERGHDGDEHDGSGRPRSFGARQNAPHQFVVPIGLWPIVIARWNGGFPMARLSFGYRDTGKAANGIYYLLRHGPILLERDASPQQTSSPPPPRPELLLLQGASPGRTCPRFADEGVGEPAEPVLASSFSSSSHEGSSDGSAIRRKRHKHLGHDHRQDPLEMRQQLDSTNGPQEIMDGHHRKRVRDVQD